MIKLLSKKSNKGFTLVELIIVIAIIAVLAAVLAPRYLQYVERSRQSNDLQVATNLMRAATVAVADPKSELPSGHYIEVLWATGGGNRAEADQALYNGILYVRPPQAVRISEMSSRTDIEPYTDTQSLEHLQDMIMGIMGVDDRIADSTGTWISGLMEDAESNVGNEASFCFHIDTTNGDIALAKYSQDGDVNLWIDEIGVDAIPAP